MIVHQRQPPRPYVEGNDPLPNSRQLFSLALGARVSNFSFVAALSSEVALLIFDGLMYRLLIS